MDKIGFCFIVFCATLTIFQQYINKVLDELIVLPNLEIKNWIG